MDGNYIFKNKYSKFLEEFYYSFFGINTKIDINEIKSNLCKIYDTIDGTYRKTFMMFRENLEKMDIEMICNFLCTIYDINIIIYNKLEKFKMYSGKSDFYLYKPFIILKKDNKKYYHLENIETNDTIFSYPNDNFLIKYQKYIYMDDLLVLYRNKLKRIQKYNKEQLNEYARKMNIDINKKNKNGKLINKTKKEILEQIYSKI